MTGLGEVLTAAALAAVFALTACSGSSPPDVMSCKVTLGDASKSVDLQFIDGRTASLALSGYAVNFQIQHAGTFVHAEMIGPDNVSLGAFDAAGGPVGLRHHQRRHARIRLFQEVTVSAPRATKPRANGCWALVLFVAAVIAACTNDSPAQQDAAARSSTDPWSWLDRFGTESPTPALPEGWKLQDVADFRFAVPTDWKAGINPDCVRDAPGLVVVAIPSDGSCGPPAPHPESIVTITPATGHPAGGAPATVGTLTATLSPCSTVNCTPSYRFDSGYDLTITGPEADDVLATFTDSGARRALQTGPMADTSAWRTVSYRGLSFDVPASWSEVDPGPHVLDPGACSPRLFGLPIVALGESGFVPTCPLFPVDLYPSDGIWARPLSDKAQGFHEMAAGRVDGLDIAVVSTTGSAGRVLGGAPLDLIINSPSGKTWISLGVGADPSVARAVLHSLHAA